MHPLSCAFFLPYMLVRVTRGALVALIGNCLSLLSVLQDLFALSVSLWNNLYDPVFVVGLAGFKSRANVFLLA